MVFSSIEFLFLFLPLALAAYWLTHPRFRNYILLFASLVFYTWGGGAFVVLLVISTVVDFIAGRMVSKAITNERPGWKTAGVTLSVVVNLSLLAYFKYANFFIQQLNNVGDAVGIGPIAWDSVLLPIGISFFTFQSMSYTIDVATGRARHLDNIFDFALYVALFPQLIAGPIVRYHEIADQIRARRTRLDDFAAGAVRFAHGLAKKVIIADSAGVLVDGAFGTAGSELTFVTAWLGAIAYTVQIYFDFSGYSDMAIGLGRILGFRFPENFRRPYSALSITDFWRRWHITLSNWFRDYLYIPLGGNRGGERATYRNLVLVFLLTGLWHGANWTFILWGGYHGTLLMVERLTGQRPVHEATHEGWRRAGVLLAVILGWVIFRAESLGQALDFYQAMFSFSGFGLSSEMASVVSNRSLLVTLVAMVVVVLLPRDFVGGIELTRFTGLRRVAARAFIMAFALPYAIILTASGSFSPFLYFQF